MDKSGLAIEAAKNLIDRDTNKADHSKHTNNSIRALTRSVGNIKITDVRIDDNAKEQIGKRPGRYITLEGEPHFTGMTALIRRAIEQVIPPHGRLFAVGLGNPDITADSLGAVVVRSVTVRKGRRHRLFAIETDVAAKTGLESARIVKAAAREFRADCVLAIDALACHDPRRIGRTVQISDAGLIPGSGAELSCGELSRETLGIPVAAVGVPTLSLLSSVTKNDKDGKFHVTTADIDVMIKVWAEAVAGALDELV